MNKTFTIKYNESDNSWIAKYIDISFNTEKISNISNEMIEACRILQSKIAYSTPDFIEAQRYIELFGG